MHPISSGNARPLKKVGYKTLTNTTGSSGWPSKLAIKWTKSKEQQLLFKRCLRRQNGLIPVQEKLIMLAYPWLSWQHDNNNNSNNNNQRFREGFSKGLEIFSKVEISLIFSLPPQYQYYLTWYFQVLRGQFLSKVLFLRSSGSMIQRHRSWSLESFGISIPCSDSKWFPRSFSSSKAIQSKSEKSIANLMGTLRNNLKVFVLCMVL